MACDKVVATLVYLCVFSWWLLTGLLLSAFGKCVSTSVKAFGAFDGWQSAQSSALLCVAFMAVGGLLWLVGGMW